MGGEKIDETHKCLVCGEEHGLDDIHTFEMKGQTKKICQECLDVIHGII